MAPHLQKREGRALLASRICECESSSCSRDLKAMAKWVWPRDQIATAPIYKLAQRTMRAITLQEAMFAFIYTSTSAARASLSARTPHSRQSA